MRVGRRLELDEQEKISTIFMREKTTVVVWGCAADSSFSSPSSGQGTEILSQSSKGSSVWASLLDAVCSCPLVRTGEEDSCCCMI